MSGQKLFPCTFGKDRLSNSSICQLNLYLVLSVLGVAHPVIGHITGATIPHVSWRVQTLFKCGIVCATADFMSYWSIAMHTVLTQELLVFFTKSFSHMLYYLDTHRKARNTHRQTVLNKMVRSVRGQTAETVLSAL